VCVAIASLGLCNTKASTETIVSKLGKLSVDILERLAGGGCCEDGKEDERKTADLAVGMCQDVRTSGFFCPSFLDASVCGRRTLASQCTG
jgi:hypothetical protein